MLHILRFFFSSKFRLFHNATVFGSCVIHILYTGCAKIKKKNSGAKGLMSLSSRLHALLQQSGTARSATPTFSNSQPWWLCLYSTRPAAAGDTASYTSPKCSVHFRLVLKFQWCKIPGTQKSHDAATARHLTTGPVTRLYGDLTGRTNSARHMVKSGVGWRYFAWTFCCLILLISVLFIKPVSKFVNLDLSWSLVLKPLFQPYLAVSDEEKWDHVAAKSASPTLLLRKSLSAQSTLAFIKWRWMLSCPI